jgi:hypothetical protein
MELGKFTNVIMLSYKESEFVKKLVSFFESKLKVYNQVQTYIVVNVILQRMIFACGFFCQHHQVDGFIDVDCAVMFFESKYAQKVLENIPNHNIVSDEVGHLQVGWGQSTDFDKSRLLNNKWNGLGFNEIRKINLEWVKIRQSKLFKSVTAKSIRSLIDMPPLVVSFDSFYEEIKTFDIHAYLRNSIAWSTFFWEHCLVLMISTLPKYIKYQEKKLHADHPEFRLPPPDTGDMIAPIFYSGNFDSLAPANIGADFTDDWMKFLFSGTRAMMITCSGRPSLAVKYGPELSRQFYHIKLSQVDFRRNSEYLRLRVFDDRPLLELIGEKRTTQQMKDRVIKPKDSVCCALFGLSLGMSKFPAGIDSIEMIKNGAMTLLGVNEYYYERQLYGTFYSEGLLSGFASFLLAKGRVNYSSRFTEWIFDTNHSFLSIREIGELIERLCLIKALCRSRTKCYREYLEEYSGRKVDLPSADRKCSQFIYQPVGLKDFLSSFLHCGNEKYFEAYPVMRKAFIAFNHFAVLSHDSVEKDPYGVMAKYLARGAALVAPPNTNGVHIMIPMVIYGDEEPPTKSKSKRAASKKLKVEEVQEKPKSFSKLSFVYIQLQVGRRVERLPTQQEVAKSSPHIAFAEHFGKGKANTPYCYIYHHLCPGKRNSVVISPEPDSQYHFPCFAIQGVRESLSKLTKLLSNESLDPSLRTNPHLRAAGTVPGTSGVMNFEESDQYFDTCFS